MPKRSSEDSVSAASCRARTPLLRRPNTDTRRKLRSFNGRPIEVRELREADAAARVHLLFVGGFDQQRVARIVRQASGAMLIVTECDSGLQLGSVINFRIVDERVRFDVSLDAAERNGIKLSSRLLTVANRVQKGAQ